MLYKLPKLNYSYDDYKRLESEVHTWPLMSPWLMLTIITCYLVFVLSIGPRFMRHRPAYSLKYILLVYNLYQALLNGWFTIMLLMVEGALDMAVRHACHPPNPWDTPYYRLAADMIWYFIISKVSDLLDTVFLVLKKKNDHISFLHVYHHTNMVIFTWTYLKFIQDPHGLLVGWLNASVHTVMYSYYFLAALGPHMRKYLWWKKYITKFQMVQFMMIIGYMTSLMLMGCKISARFAYFLIFQGVTFFILFTNFYIKAYLIRGRLAAAAAHDHRVDIDTRHRRQDKS